jgi:hypothetical protein
VDKIWVVPNPVFVAPGQIPRLYYHSTGRVQSLSVKVYTRSYTAAAYWHIAVGRSYSGWDSVPLKELNSLTAGTYFVTASADGQKSATHVTLVILR